MKFIQYLCIVFSLISVGKAEGELNKDNKLNENLLHYVAEAEYIYYMSQVDDWVALAGNRNERNRPVKPFVVLISSDQNYDDFVDAEVDFTKKMKEDGNFYLVFGAKNRGSKYFVMNRFKARMMNWSGPGDRVEVYPKSQPIIDDLMQLCRLRFFISRLSKGELKADEYRFSVREWTLIMRLCPDHWADHLVKYALSDTNKTERLVGNDYLRILLDSLNLNKDFLAKHPYLDGVDTFKKFYPSVMKLDHYDVEQLINTDYFLLLKKLEAFTKLTAREKYLVGIILEDQNLNEIRFNGHKELSDLRKYIIKHKDLELLKAYMKRVERRQSVADVLVLGEFLQSDLYLKGSAKFRHVILDQCALRKENEIVWQLADSVRLLDPPEDPQRKDGLFTLTPKMRVKMIMIKFTDKNLGDDPKAWKKWYRDQ